MDLEVMGLGTHYRNGNEDIYAIIGTWNVDSTWTAGV